MAHGSGRHEIGEVRALAQHEVAQARGELVSHEPRRVDAPHERERGVDERAHHPLAHELAQRAQREHAARVATRVARIDRAQEVTAFAVSVEPTGGSQSPTGPIVLVGAVTS